MDGELGVRGERVGLHILTAWESTHFVRPRGTRPGGMILASLSTTPPSAHFATLLLSLLSLLSLL